MRFAAIAISLWLGLTAVTATPFPPFSSDVDGHIDVRPLGDSADLGIPVDVSSLSRAAVDIPEALDITNDNNEEDDGSKNRVVYRKTFDPAKDRDYVFLSAVSYYDSDCNQYERDTRDQCKKKLPKADQNDCNKKVDTSKERCLDEVKTYDRSRWIFVFPEFKIKSPKELKTKDECNAGLYTKVTLTWCNKIWGPDGQGHHNSLKMCKHTVKKLTQKCIAKVNKKGTFPYEFSAFDQFDPSVPDLSSFIVPRSGTHGTNADRLRHAVEAPRGGHQPALDACQQCVPESKRIFLCPPLIIQSPDDQGLESKDECNADAYTTVPKKWCNKVWGRKGQNHLRSWTKCHDTVEKLNKDCLAKINGMVVIRKNGKKNGRK
ncbi:hypothetical protein HDU96_009628 [Phlyctochytrium bullatum]|nr:hypothetical protein HDU96_009628 [Phlyctochytrium bullatum]